MIRYSSVYFLFFFFFFFQCAHRRMYALRGLSMCKSIQIKYEKRKRKKSIRKSKEYNNITWCVQLYECSMVYSHRYKRMVNNFSRTFFRSRYSDCFFDLFNSVTFVYTSKSNARAYFIQNFAPRKFNEKNSF